MSNKPPTRAAIIFRARQLLRAGTLPSVLPNELMDEFGLSAEAASELAGAAVKRWRVQRPPRHMSNGGKESEKPG